MRSDSSVSSPSITLKTPDRQPISRERRTFFLTGSDDTYVRLWSSTLELARLSKEGYEYPLCPRCALTFARIGSLTASLTNVSITSVVAGASVAKDMRTSPLSSNSHMIR